MNFSITFVNAVLLLIIPSNTSSEVLETPNNLDPMEAIEDLPPSKLVSPPRPICSAGGNHYS